MDLTADTPWGGEFAAAQTLVNFIDDLKKGKPIEPKTRFMDVACAINTFLPSPDALKYFFKMKGKGPKAAAKLFARGMKEQLLDTDRLT